MTEVTLTCPSYGGWLLTARNGEDVYIQVDYEAPWLASELGWTEATLDSMERSETDEIEAASDWLWERDGDVLSIDSFTWESMLECSG